LELGIKNPRKPHKHTVQQMLDMFSNLRERADQPAGVLSGGEKQMLAMCRTLMGDPDLIMIDEPTEGLAPLVVKRIGEMIRQVADTGVSILLVEQKLSIALDSAPRVMVMGRGRIVFEGTPDQLRSDDAVRREWLEVCARFTTIGEDVFKVRMKTLLGAALVAGGLQHAMATD